MAGEREPYGIYYSADGRQVMFNRSYTPIWQKMPDGSVTRASPTERVKFVDQTWLHDDSVKRADRPPIWAKALRDFGVP
jgi:hypothetical protein